MTMTEQNNQPQEPQTDATEQLLDLEDDTPLAPACDLSGDGACEACQ